MLHRRQRRHPGARARSVRAASGRGASPTCCICPARATGAWPSAVAWARTPSRGRRPRPAGQRSRPRTTFASRLPTWL